MAQKPNSVQDVIRHIDSLGRFKDLGAGYFAPEGWAADVVAQEELGRMKVTQLRKLFSSIKSIDKQLKGSGTDESLPQDKIHLLLPEIAYAYGRELITANFYVLIRSCLSESKMRTVGDFRNFVRFLEAVLAYHKMRDVQKPRGGGRS